MLELGDLVAKLHAHAYSVAVETQGWNCPAWLNTVDLVTVSPKPPSAGQPSQWHRLLPFARLTKPKVVCKVVVGDEADLEFAERALAEYPWQERYVQVCNTVGVDTETTLLEKARWLTNAVLQHEHLRTLGVITLPQWHVLLYGNRRGV